ncbi:MAG: hypothetical protein R3E39_25055 [Anaerolineae bacterium]
MKRLSQLPSSAPSMPGPSSPPSSKVPLPPLPNYSLSTVCPACNAPTIRRACKVRCERCGFMWDCSEL